MATFGTYSGVGSTISLLEAELPRLEEQRLALEEELAAVTARLASARAALSGLQSLSPSPLLHEQAGIAPTVPGVGSTAKGAGKRRGAKAAPQPTAQQEPAPEQADAAPARKKAVGRKATRRPATGSARPEKARAARKTTATPAARTTTAVAKTAEPTAPRKRTPGVTESILAYLAKAEQPVRAGEVAQALGREATPSSVNAVRTALERLVKASRAQRTGRGLYQALPS